MEQTAIEVALALYGVAALIVIRLDQDSATLRLQETTVAASRTPFLRASVNAERGRAGHAVAAKVGNATPSKELRPARNNGRGGVHRASGRAGTGQVAHHDANGVSR